MSKNTIESVICNTCKKELICDTPYPAVYAMELRPIDVNRSTSSITYSVMTYEPKTLHFCDKKCLATWANT